MSTLKLIIEQDVDAPNPRKEFDRVFTMVCFHKRYNLGDSHEFADLGDFETWDEYRNYLVKDCGAILVSPLYLYDHSGITISERPFSCSWDSGQVGFIFTTREKLIAEGLLPANGRLTKKRVEEFERYRAGEVAEYDAYLTGEVYGYRIEDEHENTVDSCFGFYGFEYCESEGRVALKGFENATV